MKPLKSVKSFLGLPDFLESGFSSSSSSKQSSDEEKVNSSSDEEQVKIVIKEDISKRPSTKKNSSKKSSSTTRRSHSSSKRTRSTSRTRSSSKRTGSAAYLLKNIAPPTKPQVAQPMDLKILKHFVIQVAGSGNLELVQGARQMKVEDAKVTKKQTFFSPQL